MTENTSYITKSQGKKKVYSSLLNHRGKKNFALRVLLTVLHLTQKSSPAFSRYYSLNFPCLHK